MGKLFGTDGIRGTPGKSPLTRQEVRLIARSFSTFAGKTPSLLVSRDTRESGNWMQEELLKGLVESGAMVTTAGILSTPATAYLARTREMDGAIIISASHNPPTENGIKFFKQNGRKLNEAEELRIEEICFSNTATKGKGLVRHDNTLSSTYIDFVAGIHKGLESLRVVIDCANGAAYSTAPAILKKMGAEATVINAEPDGTNINKECGSEHPEKLASQVTRQKAELGIALDGDADRAVLVNEKGSVLTGDQAIGIAAIHLKTQGRLPGNKVVVTHYSSYGLEETLRQQGITLVRTDVGDQNVAAEMERHGAVLGGEQSGHIIFSDMTTTGDGIITALQIAKIMREQKKPLSQLAAQIKRAPQVTVNVEIKQKKPLESLAAMKLARQAQNELGPDGRVLLRYSGTQNLLRIMVEGKNEKQINDLAQGIARTARKELQS